MLNIFSKIFGSSNDRTIKRMQHLVDQINDLSAEMNKHDDAFFLNLRKTLNSQFKESNNDINSILPTAYAAVREASVRTLGLRHFDSQLL